jgi:hypothetical protein
MEVSESRSPEFSQVDQRVRGHAPVSVPVSQPLVTFRSVRRPFIEYIDERERNVPQEPIAMTEEQIQGLAQKLDSLDLTESDQAFLGGLLWCGTQFLNDQIEEEKRKNDPEGVPSIEFQPTPSVGACLLSAFVPSEAENEVDLFEWGIICTTKPILTICTGSGGKNSSCVQVHVPVCTVKPPDTTWVEPDS